MSLPNLVPFHRRGSSDQPALRGWDDMHREIDRVFDSFFNDAFARTPLMGIMPGSNGQMGLSLDVAETDKAYLVTAELPGLEDRDIDLSLSEGVLTLKGEKQQEEETEGKTFHRTERRYGSFKRVLQLPGDADENAVSATMKNGVLHIEIGKNKKAEPTSRKINIKAE